MKWAVALLLLGATLAFSDCSGKQTTTPTLSVDISATLTNRINPDLDFAHSKSKVELICKIEQDTIKAKIDEIAKTSPAQATFENALLPLEWALSEFSSAIEPVNFLGYVSTDPDVRVVAKNCETDVGKLHVDIFAREDLYQVVKGVKANSGKRLNKISRRLLDEYLSDFERNGLELSPAARKKYITKKKKLVELTNEFDQNIVKSTQSDYLAVSEEELDGMPEEFIKGLKKDESDNYKLTLSYPTYFPFMQNGKKADVRKRLQTLFLNRGGKRNVELLEGAVKLRHEMAVLIGRRTHADFVLEKRMAKEQRKVARFLSRLRKKLRPLGVRDLWEMLALKQNDEPKSNEIEFWDWRYYSNQIQKTKYDVDHQKIKEYFPLKVVLKGMFEIYETILNVQFVELTDPPKWHKDVSGYAVMDKKTKKVISFFYMDLFPRDGKYGHAAAFTLKTGYEKSNGQYQKPVSSIVANFNPPKAGNPSLLLHSQVETLFHELGHIMHQVLTTSKFARFSGTRVKRDFVEAPSQMLENWVWKKDSLQMLSGHYKDHSNKLPIEDIKKLQKAKLANVGIRYLRQLFFATLDMTYHTKETIDSTNIYKKLAKDIMLMDIPEDTVPQASFGHLMGGYDAGYYGYLWSEVYAADMFTRFEKEGILNAKTGADYRKWILETGGTDEPFNLIKAFLKRNPNENAFLESIGLSRRRAVSKSKKKR